MTTDKERADKKRRIVADYKVSVGCTDCGYNTHPEALEFDHIDNDGTPYSGKQRSVASMMYRAWEVIWKEIEKCEVVCANCHAIRTFQRRTR